MRNSEQAKRREESEYPARDGAGRVQVQRAPLFDTDHRDAALIAALFLMAALAFAPWLFAPGNMAPGMPGHDAQTQWHPWRVFAFEEIRHGRLPLWNPYILCGTPFAGNFQSAMFYPPNLLFLIPNVAIAARASILLHLWLSLLFTYMLARLLRCGRIGAAVSAMVFTFGAAQWLRIPAGHWGVSTAIPWLPLILFCVEWQFRRPGRWPVMAGGLAVGMQVLAGVPQYVFISAIAAGLYALLRGLLRGVFTTANTGATEDGLRLQDSGCRAHASSTSSGVPDSAGGGSEISGQSSVVSTPSSCVSPCLRGESSLFVAWSGFVAMYLLGAMISAVQLLPGLEAAANGARSLKMRPEWIQLFSLAPENLLTMFVPGIFGGTGGIPYWGRFHFWEMNAYVGIVALALVVAAFALVKPRGRTLIFAVPALVLLLLAFGRHTPLMGLLGKVLPFSDMFRGSSKFIMPFSLMLALLAGMGAKAAIEVEARPRWKLLVPLVLCIIASSIILYLRHYLSDLYEAVVRSGERLGPQPQIIIDISEMGIFHAAAVSVLATILVLSLVAFKMRSGARKIAVLALVSLDLFVFTQHFRVDRATFDPALLLTPPSSSRCGVTGDFREQLWWHIGGTVFHRPTSAMSNLADENEPAMLRRLISAAGVEPNPPARYHILVRTALGLPVNIAPSIYSLDGAPDWFLANVADESVSLINPTRPCTRAMLLFQSRIASGPEESLSLLPRTDTANVVVLENPALASMESNLPGRSCPIVSADSDHVAVQCEADREGWLVLRDNYFPGWTAEVDGVDAPIEVANFSFRAVKVPAGKHVVEFAYRPTSFRIGLALSLIGLLVCAGLGLDRWRRKQILSEREMVPAL